jgi:hypothetical protein
VKVLLVVILLFPVCLYGQLITGTLKDASDGNALPGANVYLLSDRYRGTSTNLDGKFELNAILPMDTLIVSFIGYREKRIPVAPGAILTLLLENVNSEMDVVVIKAERLIAEEFTIRKIKKLEIYTNPSAKADPILAVNSTPSATTTDESANISLRGSNPAETGIFLNNVPMHDAVRYSQLNGIGTFSIFNTALVSNVQVYPGNPPLEYGNTTSGLISLQTDEVIPLKSTTTLSATLASLGIYTLRKVSAKSSITLFSNYQPSGMIKAINPEALRLIEKFNSIDLGVHFFWQPDPRTTVKVFNYSIHESYQFHYEYPTCSGLFNQNKNRNFTISNFRRRFKNGELSINNGLSFSAASYYYSVINADIDLSDFFVSINYQHTLGKAEFKGGLSYDKKASEYKGQFPTYEYAVGPQYPIDSASSSQVVKLPEIYLYGKYFLTPKLVMGFGIRKNIPIESQRDFWSSQLNLNLKPIRQISITASIGRYNKFQLPQGQSNLPYHIAADQYSLDVSYSKSKMESSLSVFYKRNEQGDLVSLIKGIELYTRYKFSGFLRGQISLTSLDANSWITNEKIINPYDIHYFLRGNLEYKFGGTWTATAVFLFRQGSFYNSVMSVQYDPLLNVYQPLYAESSRLPSYNTIDLSLSKYVMLGVRASAVAFLGIGNLANFTNVRGYSYNFDYSQATPSLFSLRTFYFGMVISL